MEKLNFSLRRLMYLGIVVCCVVSTASAAPAIIPSLKSHLMIEMNWPNPDPNINQFPHESTCDHYYLMLSENEISLEKCPDGQLFDYTIHRCSDEKDVHCWSRRFGKLAHDRIHHKHKKHFKCPYPWGKFPHLHDCTKYHLCVNGKSRTKKCASYELFDKISRKCIGSNKAVCADETDVVEHDYKCPKVWGSFTFGKDCSKYYECLDQKPNLRTCQIDKLFDEKERRCAPKELVSCGSRYNPYEKENSVSPIVSDVASEDELTSQIVTSDSNDISKVTRETILTENIVSEDVNILNTQSVKTYNPLTPTEISETASDRIVIIEVSDKASDKIATEEISENTSDRMVTGEISEIPSISSEAIKDKSEETKPTPEEENTSGKYTVTDNDITENLKTKQQEAKLVDETVTSKEFIEVSTETKKEPIEMSEATIGEIKHEETNDGAIIKTENDVKSETPKMTENLLVTTVLDSRPQCLIDSTCVIEKDGIVIRCVVANGLEPYPGDAKRFVECTDYKIKVYSCPGNLNFIPTFKKCRVDQNM